MRWKTLAKQICAATFLLTAICAHAGTIDCHQSPLSDVDRKICADPDLLKLDNTLGDLYKSAGVDTTQGILACYWIDDWESKLEDCKDRRCIKAMYARRLRRISDVEDVAKTLAIPFTPCTRQAVTFFDVKTWPADPSKTIVLIANPSNVDDIGLYDFDLIVQDSATGKILRHVRKKKIFDFNKVYPGDAPDYISRVWIDAADYALQPERRALGVRIDSGHDGNPSADFETLYLFDFSSSRMPEILSMPVSWNSGETGTGTACISDDWHRTIAVERSMTHGYFDLRVTEKSSFTKSFTENELPGEACVCRYGHESRRRIIRFDGARYPTPPNPPDPPDAIDESNPTSQRGE